MLRRLAPDLWVAERPQRFLGIEVGTVLEHLLAWDFDRVVVAHADVLDHDGRKAVHASFAWLSRRN